MTSRERNDEIEAHLLLQEELDRLPKDKPSDGRGPDRQVTHGAGAERVRWNRATGLLFVSGGWGRESKLELKEVNPDSGAVREIVPHVAFGHDLSLYDFDISADGRWVVMSREEVRGNLWSLTARANRR